MKIFVEVGSHKMPFTRLLSEVDRLAKKNKWDVFVQKGYTEIKMPNCDSKEFISKKQLILEIKKANVVVAHAGAGNIISVLAEKKPLVIVPRRKKFDEHTDDHQTELAKVLAKEGKCASVFEINELEKAIKNSKKPVQASTQKKQTVKKIDSFLKKIESELQ